MQCTKPIVAWYGEKQENGKRGLVFKRPPSSPNRSGDLEIPCGRCMDCRLEYSRQWAIRCTHEAKLHPENCFITLTYDDEHLPENGSLVKKHLQDFYKRFRFQVAPKKIRHYSCGEYGDKNFRPHYHAVIFNHIFTDGVLLKAGELGNLYSSKQLNKLWNHGTQNSYGSLTFESAAYVSRYATKKINGDRAEHHYKRVDPSTGETIQLLPEFATMSLKPGIANDWYQKFNKDVYPADEVITRGSSSKPPKFYDRQLEKQDPELYEKIKNRRIEKAKEKGKTTEQQLNAHAAITRAKMSLKNRNI